MVNVNEPLIPRDAEIVLVDCMVTRFPTTLEMLDISSICKSEVLVAESLAKAIVNATVLLVLDTVTVENLKMVLFRVCNSLYNSIAEIVTGTVRFPR